MSITAHLRQTVFKLTFRDEEKARANKSIQTVKLRLGRHFGQELKGLIVFGSYARGTILSRKIDTRSDIDLMVVFKEKNASPQTYLNRLRRFVETTYQSSEIKQSNPTIILNLNHIALELVPAIPSWFGRYEIPAPASDYQEWLETSPLKFNQELTEKHKQSGNNLKHVIRLAKYWNSINGHVFPSFDLEKQLVNHGYYGANNIQEYFISCMYNLSLGFFPPKWKTDRLKKMKEELFFVEQALRRKDSQLANFHIKRILPEL